MEEELSASWYMYETFKYWTFFHWTKLYLSLTNVQVFTCLLVNFLIFLMLLCVFSHPCNMEKLFCCWFTRVNRKAWVNHLGYILKEHWFFFFFFFKWDFVFVGHKIKLSTFLLFLNAMYFSSACITTWEQSNHVYNLFKSTSYKKFE